MQKQNLVLHLNEGDILRAVIKTQHGRVIYLEVQRNGELCTVTECYYTDRIRGGKYCATPLQLVTRQFYYTEILDVIEKELDRKYFGIEVTDTMITLPTAEFIRAKMLEFKRKYNFLIMVGEGEAVNGMPSILRTRFKNKIYRSIYLELQYYSGSQGVVTDCRYYDRAYKARERVSPETLTTVFFPYNREAVINMVNGDLNTAFTDIIFITDNSINIENKTPLCGNV